MLNEAYTSMGRWVGFLPGRRGGVGLREGYDGKGWSPVSSTEGFSVGARNAYSSDVGSAVETACSRVIPGRTMVGSSVRGHAHYRR